jgi:predicted RNA binding protein YcfA (HicA-like mRNA interferase family)
MAPYWPMSKSAEKIWAGLQHSLHNVRFGDFCRVIEWFSFVQKGGKGSHYTYLHKDVHDIIDVQSFGGEAKPYQIRQFIRLVERYKLRGGSK